MARICIYDSGIGGLNVLKEAVLNFPGNEFVYYCDNALHPFGSKAKHELRRQITARLSVLRRSFDVVVLGCNTASLLVRGDYVRVIPPLNATAPEKTLLLATPLSLKLLKRKAKGYQIGDTSKLAQLVEACGGMPDTDLDDYICDQLKDFSDIETVILGCTHYNYVSARISEAVGCETFADGIMAAMTRLGRKLKALKKRSARKQAAAQRKSIRRRRQNLFVAELIPPQSKVAQSLGDGAEGDITTIGFAFSAACESTTFRTIFARLMTEK